MIDALFKPLRYLAIRVDAGGKLKVDVIIPLIVALVISSIFLYLKIVYQIHLFGADSSLIENIIGLIQILPGFYIAALAAISTFPSSSMDKDMPEPTPYLKKTIGVENDYLSRRRFLSYMFAYLAYISIITLFLTAIIVFAYSTALFEAPVIIDNAVYFFSCLSIYFLIIQIVFLTFVGLWYLGERIHFNDPDDVTNSEEY